MSGKLFGVGVGPGDPELMTLKAIRTIERCSVIAIPGKEKSRCMAYGIAIQSCPVLEKKELLCIYMPMTKDPMELEKAYCIGAAALQEQLDQGKDVAFLTIGDPTVYSTYAYLHSRVTEAGYETEIIPGVPSFCACAAALNIPLCENSEELHVIPGTYSTEDVLKYPGTKVLMKNDLAKMLRGIKDSGLWVSMVEKCGLPEQRIFRSLEDIPEDAGYFSVMVVKNE